jgi:HTH-type transcriptional regulator / antitoxin HigA
MASVQDGGTWNPDYAVPPGEILAEHLEARGWTQAELARRCGKSTKLISEIISGKNPIEPDTTLALERVLGMKAEIWNGIEADWRLFKARQADRQRAERHAAWVRSFPLASLKKRRIMTEIKNISIARNELLAFLGVASEDVFAARWKASAVAYRQSKTLVSSPESLSVWLRLGECKAEQTTGSAFNADRLISILPHLKELTMSDPSHYVAAAKDLCLSAGVVLTIVAPLEKTHLSGAAYRLADGRGVAQLSLRHKTNDHFWFTLFHELGHLALHKRTTVFVDDERTGERSPDIEREADEFAEERLVGRARFRDFCDTCPRSKAAVEAFSQSVGVHPGVIVGMLQHKGVIPWSHLNGFKQNLAATDHE